VPTYWKIVKTLFFLTLTILVFIILIELSELLTRQNTNPHPYNPPASPKTDGYWTDWSDWTFCDQILCDTNCTKIRTRKCIGYNGGKWCEGDASQVLITPNQKCWSLESQLANIQEKIMQLQNLINKFSINQ
jgi:hypothetical protein